jgi:hypothetical protein
LAWGKRKKFPAGGGGNFWFCGKFCTPEHYTSWWMHQLKRIHTIFIDIYKAKIIIFINKFYLKNLCTIDKKKEPFDYLFNFFEVRRYDWGSVKFITGKSCSTIFTATCKNSDSASLKDNLNLSLLRHHRLT